MFGYTQQSKTFKNEGDAKDFIRFHKKAWMHKIYEGISGSIFNPKRLVGYHVVYLLKDEYAAVS